MGFGSCVVTDSAITGQCPYFLLIMGLTMGEVTICRRIGADTLLMIFWRTIIGAPWSSVLPHMTSAAHFRHVIITCLFSKNNYTSRFATGPCFDAELGVPKRFFFIFSLTT